jgi:hypothetical protein
MRLELLLLIGSSLCQAAEREPQIIACERGLTDEALSHQAFTLALVKVAHRGYFADVAARYMTAFRCSPDERARLLRSPMFDDERITRRFTYVLCGRASFDDNNVAEYGRDGSWRHVDRATATLRSM